MSVSVHNVTHAFTVKSRWLTAAILHGVKPVENRSQIWKPGWYAVHTGVAKERPGDDMEKHVRDNCEDDSEVAMIAQDIRTDLVPKGHIAGLCRLAHALPVEAECLKDCGWAIGPVCLVIKETLWLKQPVPAMGQLGTWPVPRMAQVHIKSQTHTCAIGVRDWDTTYPENPVALARMVMRHRAALALRREEHRKKRERSDGGMSQPTLKLAKPAR